jgi:hypothetical protein
MDASIIETFFPKKFSQNKLYPQKILSHARWVFRILGFRGCRGRNSLKTSVKDTKGKLRKQFGSSSERMRTIPFCSLTFLYTTGKIVSIVESIKKGNAQKKALKRMRIS